MPLTKITSNGIGDDSITSAKIAAGVVSASDVADATLTGAKLANSTITGDKIANSTITTNNLLNVVLKFADESSTVTSIPLGGTLKFNGATLSGDTLEITGGTSWQAEKTSGFTAVAGEGYFCNTTSGAFTVTLPGSPTLGDEVSIVDASGTADTNNITISRNGNNIQGSAENLTISVERAAFTLVYFNATQGWILKNK
jgi:hypothetical protein